jgi:hypothetical protein
MLPTDPTSSSELLRAQHIVVATMVDVTFGAWEPGGGVLVSRTVEARLRLQRVLKGTLPAVVTPGVRTKFRVFKIAGSRFVAIPGVWSEQTLAPGTRHVIFSSSNSRDATIALSEPSVILVEPADLALPDIESVLRAEESNPRKSLAVALRGMSGRRASFTGLVARYVAWRMSELWFEDLHGFDLVLGEAERPDTAALFRRVVVRAAYGDLMVRDPAPSRFVARLIWGSLRLVDGSGDDSVQEFLGVCIPNLLGLEGGLAAKPAAAVFHQDERLGQEVGEMLRAHPELPGQERLLRWLAG